MFSDAEILAEFIAESRGTGTGPHEASYLSSPVLSRTGRSSTRPDLDEIESNSEADPVERLDPLEGVF